MKDCENCPHYKVMKDENGYPYGHMCEQSECDREDDQPDLDCALRE